jgi:hypothetical protein
VTNFAHPSPSDWNSDANLSAREKGVGEIPTPPMEPDDRNQLPAGRGLWPVPPHLGFVGLTGQTFRSFHYTIDEAIKHSRSNAAAMLNDTLILTALEDRLRPSSQLGWHVVPRDETDPEQVRAAAKNTLAIATTPKLQDFFFNLNMAKWYGKMAVELVWEWDRYDPTMMVVREWSPVNGDSLVPRYSFSEWGRLVNAQYEGPTDTYFLGRVHYYTPEEMESVVVHTHRPKQPDYYLHQESGALRGQGLRNGSYWMWYYRLNLLALLMDYLERFATGVWKGWFDESNPSARTDLEQAVAAYKSKSMLSLPWRRDNSPVCDLQIMEVGATSPAIIRDTLSYLDQLLRSYILGRPVPAGNIGGDEVALHEDSITGTTKSDALSLAEDLSKHWLPTLYRYNSPNVPPGKLVFDIEHANADKLLSYAQVMRELGWSVDLDHLAEVCGLRRASLDSNISTKIQSLNPTAVTDVPQGVPVAGNSPPVQPVAQQQPTDPNSPPPPPQ